MPNNLVLFTSGGREYAAVPWKEGDKPILNDSGLLAVEPRGFTSIVVSKRRLKGYNTIVGRLNELSGEVKYHAKFQLQSEAEANPLILLKQ